MSFIGFLYKGEREGGPWSHLPQKTLAKALRSAGFNGRTYDDFAREAKRWIDRHWTDRH